MTDNTEHNFALTSRQFAATAQRLPTLFDLDDQMLALLALLDGADDPEQAAQLEAALDGVESDIVHKIESYVSVIRTLEHLEAAREAEADRLMAKAKSSAVGAAWLKARLLVHMQTMGQQRIETSRFTVSVRQNPPRVEVLEPAMVPKEYERTTIKVDVDKRSILADYKATGEIPPGVSIERGVRIDIS